MRFSVERTCHMRHAKHRRHLLLCPRQRLSESRRGLGRESSLCEQTRFRTIVYGREAMGVERVILRTKKRGVVTNW